ncbi:MAG: class I SAM-dependent methyltransferase [Anaerolineae bacterium]|uniref:class I SAM-dependent methyltransferase n=1 Tax=Candidatus Amarolinea dominans TaxID=3140696 RepID=UPI00313595E4|nr:class I SAM-dependent methyltransferase [Anaerolineae bacterium]
MTWLRRSLFILASWLAYGLLTPLYEAAAWLFSNGEWHTWRRQAMVMLAGQATATGVRPAILEVGCGTGALLAELAAEGSLVVGLDRSAQMLDVAVRRLRQGGLAAERATINLGADDHVHRHGLSSNSEMRSAQGAPVIPVQGLAQAIPLPAASVDGIILTFPTAFVFDLRAWQEFRRLLAPGGRVIWVDGGEVFRPNLLARLLQALLTPDPAAQRLMLAMPGRLTDLGFTAAWHTHELTASRVSILIAQAGVD